jgi:hypothetical protein
MLDEEMTPRQMITLVVYAAALVAVFFDVVSWRP